MAANNYLSVRQETSELLSTGLGAFLADITDGRGPHSPSAELSQRLNFYLPKYYGIKEKLDRDGFDCACLALTKSGKSTLMNALIGASILPCNNVPETARIVAVQHTQLGLGEKPTLTYKAGAEYVRVEGELQIRTQLEYLNKEVRGRHHRKCDENLLSIKTEISALQHETPDEEVHLRLLDTPGPNEAGEEGLRHQVERLLDTVDTIIYILDYSKLKTAEEASLLNKLRDANPQLMQRLALRLFFVVNKVDYMKDSEGLQEEELREYVAQLITSQLNIPAFQLKPEQVMLVSAREALLSRLILLDKATPAERQKFGCKVWGKYASRYTAKDYKEEAEIMFAASGLPELEQSVLGYLYNHAGGIKLVSLLDDIAHLLSEVQNVALTGQAALKQSASQLEQESMELQENRANTLSKFGAIQADADKIEAEVIDNVQARMQTLKEKLFALINEVLDTSAEPRLPAVRSGRWRAVFEKAVSFFTRSSGQSESATRLKETLQDLHEDIMRQINAEIGEFWHELEVATNEQQQRMIANVNNLLANLARDIEGVVGSILDLQLEPVQICMEPPSAQEFHNSLQDLFSTGIGRQTRQETYAQEEEYVIWERRYRGLCRTSEYYVGRPATRVVEQNFELTTYHLQPERVKEYFTNMVDKIVETSVRHVRAYVRAYISSHIDEAKTKISSYCDSYTETVLIALRAKSQSAEEQEAGLKAIQCRLDTIKELLASNAAIMQKAALLFLDVRDAGYCWVPAGSPSDSEDVEVESEQPLEVLTNDLSEDAKPVEDSKEEALKQVMEESDKSKAESGEEILRVESKEDLPADFFLAGLAQELGSTSLIEDSQTQLSAKGSQTDTLPACTPTSAASITFREPAEQQTGNRSSLPKDFPGQAVSYPERPVPAPSSEMPDLLAAVGVPNKMVEQRTDYHTKSGGDASGVDSPTQLVQKTQVGTQTDSAEGFPDPGSHGSLPQADAGRSQVVHPEKSTLTGEAAGGSQGLGSPWQSQDSEKSFVSLHSAVSKRSASTTASAGAAAAAVTKTRPCESTPDMLQPGVRSAFADGGSQEPWGAASTPLCTGKDLEEFFQQIDKDRLPISNRSHGKQMHPLEVYSATTSTEAPTSPALHDSAVLPSDYHEHDAPLEDVRESAILEPANSGDSGFEIIDKEDADDTKDAK